MREVNYLTDKSQDSEKLLSFKEQILRDLEEANEQLLKIEKEYDLPDRSIETPSSLKEEEEAHHLQKKKLLWLPQKYQWSQKRRLLL